MRVAPHYCSLQRKHEGLGSGSGEGVDATMAKSVAVKVLIFEAVCFVSAFQFIRFYTKTHTESFLEREVD